jgi:hypothetical protein
MPDTIPFPALTPRFGLPFLFAGQSQKEFFVNQSLALIDVLLQPSVAASLYAPPSEAVDGAAYRILSPSSGSWTDREGQLAVRIAGHWQFIAPTAGMRIYDQAEDRWLCYRGEWLAAELPGEVQGGTVIDYEARALLTQIINVLSELGLVKKTQT